MKFIFTDEDIFCKDEYRDGNWLSQETGWWFPDGRILGWTPGQSRLQQIGIATHEVVEYLLVCRLGLPGNLGHWIANCPEWVASLGRADLSWERQEWNQ